LKTLQLSFGKGVEKGLEQHHGLTQAGIQVVVDRIQQFPITVRMQGIPASQILRRRSEVRLKVFHEIGEGGDFIRELRFASEQNPAEKVVKERDTLAARVLEIS